MSKYAKVPLWPYLRKYVCRRYGRTPSVRGVYILRSKHPERDYHSCLQRKDMVTCELQSGSIRARVAAMRHFEAEFQQHMLLFIQVSVLAGGTACGAIRAFLDMYDIAIDEEYAMARGRQAWHRSLQRRELAQMGV